MVNLLITKLYQLFTMHVSLTDRVFVYLCWRNLMGKEVPASTEEDTGAGGRSVFYRTQDTLS